MSDRTTAAFRHLAAATAYAADQIEAFAHEYGHKYDGPAGAPCSRCAVIAIEGPSLTTFPSDVPEQP